MKVTTVLLDDGSYDVTIVDTTVNVKGDNPFSAAQNARRLIDSDTTS